MGKNSKVCTLAACRAHISGRHDSKFCYITCGLAKSNDIGLEILGVNVDLFVKTGVYCLLVEFIFARVLIFSRLFRFVALTYLVMEHYVSYESCCKTPLTISRF
jgi:hypothetical protein